LTVGLAIVALLSKLLITLIDNAGPHLGVLSILRHFLESIGFNQILMEGMLCVLLFAGTLCINFDDLLKSKFHVSALASFGELISTLINGFGFYFLTQFFGFHIEIIYCFLFGVIILLTDPVSVISVLKRIKIHVRLKTTI
tara:strand:+ start:515 stop:937 length:423 start_codon:yes stop_codon:yes gene_type:complete